MIEEHDIPISDDTLALVYIIAALMMIAVTIVVIAWLVSVAARLLDWGRGYRERRG